MLHVTILTASEAANLEKKINVFLKNSEGIKNVTLHYRVCSDIYHHSTLYSCLIEYETTEPDLIEDQKNKA